MLGRLIQGYGKGSSNLESTTEETHSRSLLWPAQSVDYTRGLPSSPPSTPISSPTFRIGPFDDRGGIEVNENKDLRVIIAQDAFGSLDKQLVLFDSHKSAADAANVRASATVKATPRDAAKLRGQQQSSAAHQRSRSSTIGGPASAWSRPARDPEAGDKVNRLLECMFGNTSTTKSDSSTKMHILFSGQDPSEREINPRASTGRPAVMRALTSTQPVASGQRRRSSAHDDANEDVILITRLFSVPLPDSKEPMPSRPKSGDQAQSVTSPTGEDPSAKKPKLIERKTPMYAVGLLVTLPPEDVRPTFSRPPSRMSVASASFPNSFGSDFASSWTLLEAISESLASSSRSAKHFDRRIDALTSAWDAVLSGLSDVETVAKAEIRTLLQLVNREVMSSMVKTPKGPQEQRTNQRNIYISRSLALGQVPALSRSCRHLVHRLSMVLRIPKAVTGTGLVEGHWVDEARYLLQISGPRTQNYFFSSLLTAFLGQHTEWLEGSAFRWPNKRPLTDDDAEPRSDPRSRTVIISDQRSLARRLIFLLASFLPTPAGLSPFEHVAPQIRSPLPTPGLPSSSPLKHVKYADGRRLHGGRANQQVSFGAPDSVQPSTSVSSVDSEDPAIRRMRPHMERKDSDSVSIRTSSRFPIAASSTHMRKTSAANSAVTPHPATALPYLTAGTQSSYFPENAVADGLDGAASDRLANILRRDSSSSIAPRSASGSWGFLGLWPRRGTPSGSTEGRPSSHGQGNAPQSPGLGRREMNKLEFMVDEAASVAIPARPKIPRQPLDADLPSRELPVVGTPRLRVDEEDGVVDVDIAIPGFLGWEGDDDPSSPASGPFHSTPGRNKDRPMSMRSSFSHATTQANWGKGEIAAAGFLKHYHEDFQLQAVRPYSELLAEIKDSMIREAKTHDSRSVQSPAADGTSGPTPWSTFSSTLIVDVRKFSVERLSLQLKRVTATVADPIGPVSPIGRPMMNEHRFVAEPVVTFDSILVEAVEGMLDSTKALHTRTASNVTNSGMATPPGSYGRDMESRPRILRANCRQVIAEALDEVVKSVSEQLNSHENGRAITKTTLRDAAAEGPSHKDNLLRAGVRHWLQSVQARES